MIYGYIRVSSEKQTLENQKFEIKNFVKYSDLKIDHWVEETISTRKPLNKRKLSKLLDLLKEDDILITSEISRLGRSLLEIMGILQSCLLKGCQIWTIKENYRLGMDLQSKVMAFAFGLAAEIERQLISDRTRASLEKLKADGKRLGRPKGSRAKALKLSNSSERVKVLIYDGCSQAEVSRILGVDKSTIHRFLLRGCPTSSEVLETGTLFSSDEDDDTQDTLSLRSSVASQEVVSDKTVVQENVSMKMEN